VRWWPGLRPGPHWRSLHCFSDPLAGQSGGGDEGKRRDRKREETEKEGMEQALHPVHIKHAMAQCTLKSAKKTT